MKTLKPVFQKTTNYQPFGVKVHNLTLYSLRIDEVPQAYSLNENVYCKQDITFTVIPQQPALEQPSSFAKATARQERLDKKP